jgi:hypothetical protein
MNGLDETVFRNGRLKLDKNDQGSEICNECGQSVHASSGNYVNRVIDFNGYKTRKEMGKPFPVGDYICAECETEQDAATAKVLPFPARREEEE